MLSPKRNPWSSTETRPSAMGEMMPLMLTMPVESLMGCRWANSPPATGAASLRMVGLLHHRIHRGQRSLTIQPLLVGFRDSPRNLHRRQQPEINVHRGEVLLRRGDIAAERANRRLRRKHKRLPASQKLDGIETGDHP